MNAATVQTARRGGRRAAEVAPAASRERSIRVLVRRSVDGADREFAVRAHDPVTVLDLLREIQRSHDPSLAFRYSCRVAMCGTCGVRVDGRSTLAYIDILAVAPGRQVRREESGRRSVAEYRFDHPAEGIWVMAGPYQVAERSVQLDDGKRVTVRTWFPAELSDLSEGYLEDSARYIQRYSRSIGAYPFGEFSIVASPL